MLRKILYYESGSGFGGSAVSLYRLIKYLDRKRIQPFVLVHGIGPRIEQIKNMGVNVYVLRNYKFFPMMMDNPKYFLGDFLISFCFYINFALNTLLNALIIGKFIKRQNISLVHLNNGIFENFPGLIAAKLCGIPCVSHVRGTEPLFKVDRAFGRWVDKIITLNSKMKDLYASAFGANKSCIIFNGVDLDAFEHVDKRRIKREYQVADNHFLVGTIARLVPGKGIPEFIKAAAEVMKVDKKVIFFMIGDDPLLNRNFEHEMKRLSSDLGINENVIFTGWRDDVIDLMSGLDLVVQVSTFFPEGMSLVPIEAMALSKPVITSKIPGYTDTVEHGVTGFIVPPGDISTLAKEILKLASDKHLAELLGTNGRQKVLKELDAKITTDKIQKIYNTLLSKKGFGKVFHKDRFLGAENGKKE